MADAILQAYFKNGVFIGICPVCKESHQFNPNQIPKTAAPSIPFTCSCGIAYQVQAIGMRRFIRKEVKLAGILFTTFKDHVTKTPCTIMNICEQGVGLRTSVVKLSINETVRIKFALADIAQTTLAVTGQVRRVTKEGDGLFIGIQLLELPLDTAKALKNYTKI